MGGFTGTTAEHVKTTGECERTTKEHGVTTGEYGGSSSSVSIRCLLTLLSSVRFSPLDRTASRVSSR